MYDNTVYDTVDWKAFDEAKAIILAAPLELEAHLGYFGCPYAVSPPLERHKLYDPSPFGLELMLAPVSVDQ